MDYLKIFVESNLPLHLRDGDGAERAEAEEQLVKQYQALLGYGWTPQQIVDQASFKEAPRPFDELTGGWPIRDIGSPSLWMRWEAAFLVQRLIQCGLFEGFDWKMKLRLQMTADGSWEGHTSFILDACRQAKKACGIDPIVPYPNLKGGMPSFSERRALQMQHKPIEPVMDTWP